MRWIVLLAGPLTCPTSRWSRLTSPPKCYPDQTVYYVREWIRQIICLNFEHDFYDPQQLIRNNLSNLYIYEHPGASFFLSFSNLLSKYGPSESKIKYFSMLVLSGWKEQQLLQKYIKMQLIFGRFEKQHLIQKTANKQIWLLQNASTGEKYVGKFQPKGRLDKANTKNVLHEASFLQQLQGHTGVPLMYWSGVENSEILVISQYLGFTVEQRLKQCGEKFTLKTTCMLGIQILNAVRNLHEKGVVNRNLNMTSLQFGRGLKCLTLYMNDLIDCKRFRNKKSYSHIPPKKGIKFSYDNIFGSSRYHQNQEIARIDDIESIVKILICCITGSKPNKRGEFSKTAKIPTFLQEMLKKCHATDFAEDPNYEWFNQKLLSVLFHNSLEDDSVYDWMVAPNRIERLRVSKYIPNLQLDEDKQILAEHYDPYEQSVDIDEVTTKHFQFYGAKEGKVNQFSEENKKSEELERKLKKRKTIVKEKPDCALF